MYITCAIFKFIFIAEKIKQKKEREREREKKKTISRFLESPYIPKVSQVNNTIPREPLILFLGQ